MLEIEATMTQCLAELIGMDAARIDPRAPLSDYGVDSLLALRWAGKLAPLIGREVELEWLYDYPTIAELAAFLDGQRRAAA